MRTSPLPLFDNLQNIASNHENVILPSPDCYQDFKHCLQFLRSYSGSQGTFNSYRRESERLLQWCWLIKKTNLQSLNRAHIEEYIQFCQTPPKQWINLKKVPRFIEVNNRREPNKEWRPFVVTVSKFDRKNGIEPNLSQFSLSQGAVQEIFAILSTLFNFLIAENHLTHNPVALMRQKSKFIRKMQHHAPVRRLSIMQWNAVLDAAESLAQHHPEKHERTRFILSLLYGMYLRISELAASDRWVPTMNDFAKDSNGYWWFTTVGKGNKERQIAVSDAMLESLMRWRRSLGLTPLPFPGDNSPLIPKIRGNGPMSDTAPLRRLVQECYDLAAEQLRQDGFNDEADILGRATVHWLRHTGISEDVKIRPREHVRDDAGHSSSMTTDRYIDIEKAARYRSAKNKLIEPCD